MVEFGFPADRLGLRALASSSESESDQIICNLTYRTSNCRNSSLQILLLLLLVMSAILLKLLTILIY